MPTVDRFMLVCVILLLAGGLLAACGEDEAIETPSPALGAADGTGTVDGGADASSAPTDSTAAEGTPTLQQWQSAPAMALEDGANYFARVTTNKGEIIVDLFETEAPKTVNNFVFLANEGFYTNVPFHRIISGFMIQSGDPTGTGAGGPGYRFEDEPIERNYVRGTLAMANAGPNTNGSQFFITHVDLTGRLDKNYTIFGEVTQGMDVVDAIAETPVQANARGERSEPTEPVVIESVEIFTQ
jgi:peptidylprolyl isomerase